MVRLHLLVGCHIRAHTGRVGVAASSSLGQEGVRHLRQGLLVASLVEASYLIGLNRVATILVGGVQVIHDGFVIILRFERHDLVVFIFGVTLNLVNIFNKVGKVVSPVILSMTASCCRSLRHLVLL